MQSRTRSPAVRGSAPLASRLRRYCMLLLGPLLVLPACGPTNGGSGKSIADIRTTVPALCGEPWPCRSDQGERVYRFETSDLMVNVFAESETAPIRDVRVIVKRGSIRTSASCLETVVALQRALSNPGKDDPRVAQWIADNQQELGALRTFGDVNVAIVPCR